MDDNCLNPPVYVVSVAGAKMYGLSPHVWSDRYGSQTQFYQYVTIDGNILEYEAYTVTGELYDAFTIEKDNEGFNHFSESELVESLPVYTGIPEDRIGRYSEEELKLYQDVFNN